MAKVELRSFSLLVLASAKEEHSENVADEARRCAKRHHNEAQHTRGSSATCARVLTAARTYRQCFQSVSLCLLDASNRCLQKHLTPPPLPNRGKWRFCYHPL